MRFVNPYSTIEFKLISNFFSLINERKELRAAAVSHSTSLMRGTNTGTTDEFVTISGFGLESLTLIADGMGWGGSLRV